MESALNRIVELGLKVVADAEQKGENLTTKQVIERITTLHNSDKGDDVRGRIIPDGNITPNRTVYGGQDEQNT